MDTQALLGIGIYFLILAIAFGPFIYASRRFPEAVLKIIQAGAWFLMICSPYFAVMVVNLIDLPFYGSEGVRIEDALHLYFTISFAVIGCFVICLTNVFLWAAGKPPVKIFRWGGGERSTSLENQPSSDELRMVGWTPGKIAVAIVAIGLIAYVFWSFYSASAATATDENLLWRQFRG